MRCPKCGFNNPSIRLFCAKCGEILPESDPGDLSVSESGTGDIAAPENAVGDNDLPESAWENGAFEWPEALQTRDDIRFVPLTEEPEAAAEPEKPASAPESPAAADDEPPFEIVDMFMDESAEKAKRRSAREKTQSPAPDRLNEAALRSRKETLIPERDAIPPDKLFTVRGQVDDLYRTNAPDDDDEYDYSEEEEDSFIVRHTRGIVFVLLFALTLAVVFAWSLTESGKRVLATRGFAWSSSTFAEMGYEAYTAGDYEKAVGYLKKADKNESNLIMLANSYIELDQTLYAAAAVRDCIRLNPYKADYYVVFERLLGGYDKMSPEDKQIYEDGYILTGDPRLKVN